MYRIVKVSDGKELGMVETVTYVKIGSSGDFAIADQDVLRYPMKSVRWGEQPASPDQKALVFHRVSSFYLATLWAASFI